MALCWFQPIMMNKGFRVFVFPLIPHKIKFFQRGFIERAAFGNVSPRWATVPALTEQSSLLNRFYTS
jgi:hypothetical protein